MATIAHRAGLNLHDRLVHAMVDAAMRPDGVSPVDIGIAMLVLSELSTIFQRSELTLDDYRFAGGSTGLLIGYVQDQLSRMPDYDRDAVLKALLQLVDLDLDQRVAEGRALLDLAAVSRLPEDRLRAYLDRLETARLLEEPSAGIYRLQHERIIPALRRLTGTMLAEVEKARFLLQSGSRIWLQRRRPAFLLKGSDLRLVTRYRDRVLTPNSSDERIAAESDYLRLSLRRRERTWCGIGFAVVVAVTCAVIVVQLFAAQREARRMFSVFGVGPGLTGNQVDTLWEISRSPRRVRLSLLDQALSLPADAYRFNDYAPYIIHASVGFRAADRDKVLGDLVESTCYGEPLQDHEFLLACANLILSLDKPTGRGTELLLRALEGGSIGEGFSRNFQVVSDHARLSALPKTIQRDRQLEFSPSRREPSAKDYYPGSAVGNWPSSFAP
jgi:hypothetical protein